jgi:prepilin-type N-terminal cleavage/methylation domain-containing protein/prepilin-type processing-associated H-X9-DG protein
MVRERKKAFTLVELLVVISIIALLLSILFPALNKAKENAKKIVCKNNIRSVGFANLTYSNDYSGSFFVAADPAKGPTSNQYWGNVYHNYPDYWPIQKFRMFGVDKNGDPLEPLTTKKYLATKDVFYCPNYFKTFSPTYGDQKAAQNNAWHNSQVGMVLFVNAFYKGSGPNLMRMKLKYSDRSTFTGGWGNVPMAKSGSAGSGAAIAQDLCMQLTDGPGGKLTGVFKMSHKGGVNVTFMDGHSTYVSEKELDSKNYRATSSYGYGNYSMYPDQM